MIPKIIHQTWKNETIPERWKDAVDSCKKIHKGYRYILWTDKMMRKFVQKFYPDFYPIYRNYSYNIQRCDAFRYLVLYKYGGIYLDLDTVCKKKVDTFLHYDLVIAGAPSMSGYFTNCFMMAIPKHPFIRFCIDELEKYKDHYSFFGKGLHVFHSTGPFFLTNRYKEYAPIPNIRVLTKREFTGDCNFCTIHKNILDSCKGGEYFQQILGRSWFGYDSYIYTVGACNYQEILGGLLLATLIGSEYYYWNSGSSPQDIPKQTT